MRTRARRRLPRGLFDYIDRGVGEEAGMRALRDRLDAVTITPRILRSDHGRSVACTLFGRQYAAPLAIAPTAMAGLIQHNGEIALANAAAALNLPFCLSTQSVTSLRRLREAVPSSEIWMQLYLWQDRQLSLGLLDRARDFGARVVVLTVDTPYGARKPWNERSGFGMPFRLSLRSIVDLASRPGWLVRAAMPGLIRGRLPELGNYPEGLRPTLIGGPPDPRVILRRNLSWDDVDWVRAHWDGPLVVKGILCADDARMAVDRGADGLVISSHGARNFDAAPAPIDMVQQIAKAVGARATVLADGGVRSGLDVLRYRVRGAHAVLAGRLPLWALAAGGEPSVRTALRLLTQDYVEALDFGGLGSDDL